MESRNKNIEKSLKTKKLSLQEYFSRRGVRSKDSSVTVRPIQATHPGVPSDLTRKLGKCTVSASPDGINPMTEAANRILLRLKKQRVEANRRREDAVIRSRVSTTEGLQLKPLMSPLARKPTVSESSDPSCRSTSSLSGSSGYQSSSATSSKNDNHLPVDERQVVFVGRLEKDATKQLLGNQFAKFGRVMRVQIYSHDNGTRYGFVTYERARDAWAAVKAASTFARYDVRFGAHCAFFRQSDADLDVLEA